MSEKRLKALARLLTILQEKGDVPEDLLEAANMPAGARQKDVESALKKEKKERSVALRKFDEEKRKEDREEEARRAGITLEELEEAEARERAEALQKDFDINVKKVREKERRAERSRKESERAEEAESMKWEPEYD